MKEVYVAKLIQRGGVTSIASTFWTDYEKLKKSVDRANKNLKWLSRLLGARWVIITLKRR